MPRILCVACVFFDTYFLILLLKHPKSAHLTAPLPLSACQQCKLILVQINTNTPSPSIRLILIHSCEQASFQWRARSSGESTDLAHGLLQLWPAVLMRSNRYTQFPKQLCPRHSSAATVQPGGISTCRGKPVLLRFGKLSQQLGPEAHWDSCPNTVKERWGFSVVS